MTHKFSKVIYSCKTCNSNNYTISETHHEHITSAVIENIICTNKAAEYYKESEPFLSVQCHECGQFYKLTDVKSKAEFIQKYGIDFSDDDYESLHKYF